MARGISTASAACNTSNKSECHKIEFAFKVCTKLHFLLDTVCMDLYCVNVPFQKVLYILLVYTLLVLAELLKK